MRIDDVIKEIIENGQISSTSEKYVEQNSEILARMLDDDYTTFSSSYNSDVIGSYVEFFNNLRVGNPFREYLFEKLYKFYLSAIDSMIKQRQDYLIFLLIDLLWHQPEYFDAKTQYFKEFSEKTYPILFIDDDDYTSFILIAENRFLSLLKFIQKTTKINLYDKFRLENEKKFDLLNKW